MCLAIPARVVELLPGQQAVVDLSGVRKQVSIALVDDAQLGDMQRRVAQWAEQHFAENMTEE